MHEPPECLTCGACCFSNLPTYLRLSGDDHARLGDDAARLTHFVGTRCYMRLVDGHCAARAVDGASARIVCSAYERRPQTGRDLERGSPECAGERAEKNDRPRRALAIIRG
jgi:Fe-S-cluster containining protein